MPVDAIEINRSIKTPNKMYGTLGNNSFQNRNEALSRPNIMKNGISMAGKVSSSNIKEENNNVFNISGLKKVNLNQEKKHQQLNFPSLHSVLN